MDCLKFYELNHLARGNMECIKIFHDNGYLFDTGDMAVACGEGNEDVVKLFLSYGIVLDLDCMAFVTRADNKYIIERCIDTGIIPNRYYMIQYIFVV